MLSVDAVSAPRFGNPSQSSTHLPALDHPISLQVGSSLPPGDRHAVSVYLPKWSDTVGWANRDPQLVAKLKTGYPRFFVPLIVEDLSRRLLRRAASKLSLELSEEQLAVLSADEKHARLCQEYLRSHGEASIILLRIHFSGAMQVVENEEPSSPRSPHENIYAILYPKQLAKEGKAFWQHTGFGITTRCAYHWTENAPFLNEETAVLNKVPKCLPFEEAGHASSIIQQRICDLLSTETSRVEAEAIFLYSTGMAAISHSATALKKLRGGNDKTCRVAVFGFLYVDTFKVLGKVHGFECKLYGHATPSDLEQLEADLEAGLEIDALYTEFPGNPLLGSVDVEKLYELSKKHDFVLVVDDTVATSVNVDLLSSCDVICTSLTKMFSGGCNVMGGSVALNPQSDKYSAMRATLAEQRPETYFPEDVVVMERNSADFDGRVVAASRNAERIADTLREHPSVSRVFYPKGNPTQDIYERYKRPERGYGYLLSIRFNKPEAAIAFHDALHVAKGPSLGTNFTLCCAYTLLAHASELDWAAQYGVVEHLVRISVGIEDEKYLDGIVQRALEAAAEHQ